MRDTTCHSVVRPLVWLAVGTGAFLLPALALATPPSPELQARVRSTTFEVVVRKSEPTHVTYEKALPLELIPFAERHEPYWSIGTAFALEPGVFASAAHVVTASFGSPFGAPALRDASGKVYPINRILKYSLAEDFVTFSVVDPPSVAPLEARREYSLDSPVFAAGNALGEGVILRDGLLTSVTPEALDGRWQWLRFSAAASPGNSGGPLLDAEGRVIGVVIGKSPNENLNYALPIARVLDGPAQEATLEVRSSFSLPILRDPIVADYRKTLPLPAPYARFAQQFLDASLTHYREQSGKLLAAQSDVLFPRGDSAKLLTTLHDADIPGLVSQQDDGTWHVDSGNGRQDIALPSGARVRLANVTRTTLFRLQVSPTAAPHDTSDSRAFMDDLLKALRFPRVVGTQAIRITSLGAAVSDERFTDPWGRVWQFRCWPLGYVDLSVLVASLPTPDGALGMIRLGSGQQLDEAIEELKLLAGYFYFSYSGTLSQWRGFLARSDFRPRLFQSVTWQAGADVFSYASPWFTAQVPARVVPLTDAATLDLRTTYVLHEDKLSWQVAGLRLSQDVSHKTSLTVTRQFQPPAPADPERQANWTALRQRSGRYAGTAQHNNDSAEYWMRTAVGDESTSLYEVLYRTELPLLPRQLDEIRDELLRDIKVTGP